MGGGCCKLLTIIVCDDQPLIVREYGDLIRRVLEKHSIEASILYFYSAEELLAYMENAGDMTDILFLDIHLHGISGMEAAKRLRESGCEAQLIFLTSSEEYVYDAFQVEPLCYLVKSKTSPEKVEEILLKAIEKARQRDQQCFLVETASYCEKIPLRKIVYFSVKGRLLTAHLRARDVEFYGRMDQVERQLAEKGFLRIHRSYLVNGSYIKRVDREGAVLGTGCVLPISNANYSKVKKAFSQYLFQDI